jgi:Flp pilus assembly protein TadD
MTMPAEPTTIKKTMWLCVSTALAVGLLAGCTSAGPRPSRLASGAAAAVAEGNAEKAVTLAEKAVLTDPRNPAYRTLLGNSYLRAGRFESARQAYDEAMQLGEDSGKAALSLALADIAMGRLDSAADTLETYRAAIPAADFGLAMAMAGRASRGVAVLVDALRNGEDTPKVRQNLAYGYALAGQWTQAKVMAAQDVPADQIDARMEQWLMMSHPRDTRARVATLIGAPVRGDSGQPQALALANFPDQPAQVQQASADLVPAPATGAIPAATADAPALALAAVQELPASASESDTTVPMVADASRAPQGLLAAIDAMPAQANPYHRVTAAYTMRTPASESQVRPAATTVRTTLGGGTHLVQLGAFSTPEGAQRAWRHFTKVNPALAGHRSVISQANVNGRQFWRVQAAGFSGFADARSVCGSVKARGGPCLVMAAAKGSATGADTRFARRR